MFIAMNNFQVNPGREADFENQWRTRETYLQEVPGFVHFMLLKGDNPGEYVSHSIWKDRAAFDAWTKSQAFTKGHAQGSLQGILAGHPFVRLFESIIEERKQGEASPV